MVNSEKNIFREIKKSSAYSEDMLYQCCAIFVPFSIFTLRMSEIYLQLFRAADKQKELKPYDFSSLWRRVRDLNPRDAHHAYTISNRAPSTTQPTLHLVKLLSFLMTHR